MNLGEIDDGLKQHPHPSALPHHCCRFYHYSLEDNVTTQIKCDGCATLIDDYDDDPYQYTDTEGQVFCEKCQAAHMANGWLLAQEFGAEMRYRDAVVEYLRPVEQLIEALIDTADLNRKISKGE